MVNSCSGGAAAGVNFSLKYPMLFIAGSLVGSSGVIRLAMQYQRVPLSRMKGD